MRHLILLTLLVLSAPPIVSQAPRSTDAPSPAASSAAEAEAATAEADEQLAELLAAAVVALADQRLEEAAELFAAASRSAPEDPRPWLGSSRVAERRGDLLSALKHTRQAYNLTPGDADVGLELGRLLTRMGTVGEALEVFAEVRGIDPQRSEAYFLPAMILRDVGQYEASLQLLEAAQQAGAATPRSQEELALRYLSLGRHDEALAIANDLLTADETRPLAHLISGLAQAADPERHEEARRHLERAIALGVPDSGRVHLELGILWLAQGQAESALGHLQKAREAMPDIPEVHYRLAAVHRTLGNDSAAQQALQRFQELNRQRDDIDWQEKELGTALNGIQELAATDQLGAARQQLAALLEAHPQAHRAHALMAKIQFSSGFEEDAAASILAARQLAPREVEYHFLEGYFAAHRHQPELARDALERALALDDELPEAHGLLAVLAAQDGRHPEAAMHFERALALGLDNADLRQRYAAVLDALGRPQEAEEQRAAAAAARDSGSG